MSESFFSRWSRQKRQTTRSPSPSQALPASTPTPTAVSPVLPEAPATASTLPNAPTPHEQSTTTPSALPTLEETRALTPASDFQPFMQRGVGPEVRNAAMKKLFTDPHFNVMDGLDIYIDDYSQPDPMPAGMLRALASAQWMGVVQPQTPAPTPSADPRQNPVADAGTVQSQQVVAQSPDSLASTEPPTHDHTDLQLQPKPASADPATDPGAG